MGKHTRPHTCKETGCNRQEGFTSAGDLKRHHREVHGGGERLFCSDTTCKRHTERPFARSDNLQNHINRVHKKEKAPMAQQSLKRSRSASENVFSSPATAIVSPLVSQSQGMEFSSSTNSIEAFLLQEKASAERVLQGAKKARREARDALVAAEMAEQDAEQSMKTVLEMLESCRKRPRLG
jgi:hypothetical protein